MDWGIIAGDTDQTIYFRLRDSATGLAKTGLAFNSAGAVASYTLPGAARAAITLATQTANGAHSDGGFVEVDGTNCKGLYRLDLPDAAIASGKYSIVSIEFDGIIEESQVVPLSLRKADVRQLAGVTQSLTDLKDFADDGYDPSTNKVQGVVLADTVAAYTGNTPQTADHTANIAAVKAKTDQFAFGTANRVNAQVFGMEADTINSTSWAASATTEVQSGLATAAALATVDGIVDDILLDTAEIGTAGAGLTAITELFPANFSTLTITSNAVSSILANTSHGGTSAKLRLNSSNSTPALYITHDGGVNGGAAVQFEGLDGSFTSCSALKLTGASQGDGLICSGITGAFFTDIECNGNLNIGGSLLAVTNGLPWNAAWDAEVQSEAADALNAYDPPTNAEMEARTLVAANYFDPAVDTVANVTTVGSVTTKTGYELTSAYDFAKGTIAMTEAYAANGAAPTPVQAMMAIHQLLMQFAIAGTSLTVKKLDNSTTAFIVTLSDATNPTGAVRT